MNRKFRLLLALVLVSLCGCGHTSATLVPATEKSTTTASYYAATATKSTEDSDGMDGASPKSEDNDYLRKAPVMSEYESGRKARLCMLRKSLDVLGDSLANATSERRLRRGAHHDRNDSLEALLYATFIRIGVHAIRDVVTELLENDR